MRVIARKTLRKFVEALKGSKDQKVVKSALDAWFHEVLGAEWKGPADLLKAYANASTARPHRVVFDIKGNDRLVAATNYRHRIEFIKWIGTDADYNEIEVETVRYGHQTDSRKKQTTSEHSIVWNSCGIPRRALQKETSWVLSPRSLKRMSASAVQFDSRGLIGIIGQRTRVYEVMRGKKSLSLNMIRGLPEKSTCRRRS